MYEPYWELTAAPFANRLSEPSFYESPLHEEALARLYYCVEQTKALALLHGPRGCGKSQVLDILTRQTRRTQRYIARICPVNLTEAELLAELHRQWRLGGCDGDPVRVHWQRLRDFLESTAASGIQTVLVVDNFETARDSAIAAVRRLVDWQQQSQILLTTVLALVPGKFSQALQELVQLADLGIELAPLSRPETESYVQKRLETAGCEEVVFAADALDQLQRLTGGVPREINRLSDLALLAGMHESQTAIDPDLIQRIARENLLPVSE